MKIKCVKMQCPICHVAGSAQLFLNRKNEVRYARLRHYKGLSENKKPQFNYHKVEDLEALKTLLKSQGISLNTEKAIGQLGQGQAIEIHDRKLKESNPIFRNRRAGSLARLGHQPPTLGLNNFDLTKYREFLFGKYARQYSRLQYGYVVKYGFMLENPNEIDKLPLSIKSNVLKSLVNLAKFLGQYESFKSQLKNYGIKWSNGDNSFNAFLNIINNKHSTLGEWYRKALPMLSENEQLWLRFTLITGLRKQESIEAFNRIIMLAEEGKLHTYYNEDLQMLSHFSQLDENGKPTFLRVTKNAFISFVPKILISEIAESSKVFYTTIRKHLEKNKLKLRIKELRSYNNTFLRKNGLMAELVDLLAGRVKRQVFLRHYLKIESLKELSSQVLAVTATMESSLLS